MHHQMNGHQQQRVMNQPPMQQMYPHVGRQQQQQQEYPYQGPVQQ